QELVEEGVDLLFCNEEEAYAFTGTDARQAATAALSAAVPAACITCGADGAILCDKDGTVHIPGVHVDAVDTTGAGDLFAGGALYGLSHGLSPADSARLGSYAAAQVVARFGPRLEDSLADRIDGILAHFAA
ncbi:MAG: PfkB family carbohydrate kinase, partial [Candidatus Latescibacteria bacterium]|nr:PfkB family carbohydrate kinase [Candidatus Latescibacterota bacterium]